MIKRLLIANRGEIAVRIARGARELGIAPLGIYSQADEHAMHVQAMDEAICIGPATAAQSYLNIEAVVAAAKTMRADAVHPGYGFLSERAEFARAVRDAGLIFVGPSPEAMAAMGSKREAKTRAREHHVPVIPGYEGSDQAPETLREHAAKIGTPLLIKASAGGGGRGMRVVDDLAQFDEALESAKREAQAAFGDATVLLERYLKRPRHIEIQVLADGHGNTVHFGERECSIQRRHQKIVEEAPSIAVSAALRAEMGAAAIRAAQSVNYENAGTVEFMLDEDGSYYFLEMNTRLQVEHPVTELAYGVDLVHWQLRIASGERLTIKQETISPRGAAIEVRIYAEDPYNDMLPSTGRISTWHAPEGPGIRLDSGVREGSDVSVYYDPMLAKLIVWGADRPAAIARMRQALDDFAIGGVRTNVPLLSWIVRNDAYAKGDTTTQFLSEHLPAGLFKAPATASKAELAAAVARCITGAALPWRIGGIGMPLRFSGGAHEYAVEVTSAGDGQTFELSGDVIGTLTLRGAHAALDGQPLHADSATSLELAPPPSLQSASQSGAAGSGRILSPMPGKIVKIAVKAGDVVAEHDLLLVLEAMKMEHRIVAPSAGSVSELFVKEGEIVGGSAPLVHVE